VQGRVFRKFCLRFAIHPPFFFEDRSEVDPQALFSHDIFMEKSKFFFGSFGFLFPPRHLAPILLFPRPLSSTLGYLSAFLDFGWSSILRILRLKNLPFSVPIDFWVFRLFVLFSSPPFLLSYATTQGERNRSFLQSAFRPFFPPPFPVQGLRQLPISQPPHRGYLTRTPSFLGRVSPNPAVPPYAGNDLLALSKVLQLAPFTFRWNCPAISLPFLPPL